MEKCERKPFNRRAFVALTATLAGVTLPVSGLADHLLHGGSVSPARHEWMAAHGGLGVLFATFLVWHVILNHHALFKHLKGRPGQGRALSREALWAGALVGLALLLSVGHAWHLG